MEELFYSYMRLKQSIQFLAAIVQNEGLNPTKEELQQFSKDTTKLIEELKILEQKVYEFYSLKDKPIIEHEPPLCVWKSFVYDTCSVTGAKCHYKNTLTDVCYQHKPYP